MSDNTPNNDVILISASERHRLQTALHEDDRVNLRQVIAPEETLPTLESNGVTGIVLGLEDPTTVESVLDQIRTLSTSSKVLVAPENGSERLATVSFRSGASDYLSSESTSGVVDRVVTELEHTVDSASQSEASPDHSQSKVSLDQTDESYEELFGRALPEEAFVIDENGTYLDAQISVNSSKLYDFPAEDLLGLKLDDVFSAPVATSLQDCITRTIESGSVQSIEYQTQTAKGLRTFEARVILLDEQIHGKRAVVWLARDITDWREKEQRLRSRHKRLERTNEINAVVKEVIKTVVESPTRPAIEENVCDRLVESELYSCALVGEVGGDSNVFYRVGSGGPDAELTKVIEQDLRYQQAIETGEIQSFSDDDRVDQPPVPLEGVKIDSNINSAMVVPIAHDDLVYGVLTVFATRSTAFGSRERDSFRLLGESIGFSINAVKNRRLLFSDAVVELEIRIDGGDSISFHLSEKYDCTCSLKWAGTTARGNTYQYVLIDGIGGDTVRKEAEQHNSVQEYRIVHDGDEHCIAELRLVKSGVRALSNLGVTIRDISVEDSVTTCLLDVPRDADVREILNNLGQIYQNTELVARREVDRSVRTVSEQRDRILDQLTEKQLTTLRLAYYGGYFDWPRGSTGEEIAEAMDVAPPTMHQHLRKALQELLCEFLEEGTQTVFDGDQT
ncbi:bacterio-opsin activator domain-containing protein [Halostagnicola sp. A-GB9-2]|uniref:bacterio-opsin activator domain-containing protein n=1 Tax=Halostagnicola sp. A-GB9-2 TaxID=3048066 RepID=UPI0024BFD891|nr:bacterio-opsin activator domain-containing protein [Halostagnicola sp. A-GB9-2]MDJ1434094.1 bacterio-opsin activator domain-containing protein [Halostagnicola sp. A-GB9-2]